MRTEHLTPAFVEPFPATLEDGVLYISIEFCTCAHLCACGCGEEVVTALSPAQWAFTYNGRDVTLRPSVGSWTLQCQSHYIVDNGRVRWTRQFSRREITQNRERDRFALGIDDGIENHVADTDRLDNSEPGRSDAGRRVNRWARLRNWFRHLG